LREDSLDCYENCPNLEASSQFPVSRTTAFAYQRRCLFRIVTSSGSTINFKVKDSDVFETWIKALSTVDKLKLEICEDVVDKSPLAVSIAQAANGSKQQIQVRVDGYQLLNDERGQYAAFNVQIIGPPYGIRTVVRRFSEFRAMHRNLRQVFPHDQVPQLPHTRMWGKLESLYLKEKCASLNGYLSEVNAICADTKAYPILEAFLDINTESTTQP